MGAEVKISTTIYYYFCSVTSKTSIREWTQSAFLCYQTTDPDSAFNCYKPRHCVNHRLEMMFGISYFLQFLTVVSVIFELVTPIPTPNCVNVGNNGQRRPICNGDFCENPQNYPEELITQLIHENPPPRGLFDSTPPCPRSSSNG